MNNLKTILFAVSVIFSFPAFAQKLNNTIKVNASSLALKNFSFQYERGITRHISFALGVRVEPKGDIPFKSTIENAVKNGDFDFDKLQIGNTAITPELRFYLGHGRNRGFYIAPYARYASFKLTLPVNYQSGSGTSEALFDGKVTSFSGGVLFGMQYTFGKVVVLDIWLIGAHYGSSNGTATFISPQQLSQQEQESLQEKLDEVKIKPFDFSGTVNDHGAVAQTKGPWVGVRALGINLGIRF